ncbi:hypothetical protein BJ170DRAFT_305492 [Xylariales sp. AK1849]|nr:hypothetical protein BJ170DRAFT_305492 [Xylariales sp. AK1849]
MRDPWALLPSHARGGFNDAPYHRGSEYSDPGRFGLRRGHRLEFQQRREVRYSRIRSSSRFDYLEIRRDCFCLSQFNVKTCSVQGIYKISDVLEHDPGSLSCPKLIPGWSTDLRIEQINRYPIPSDELMRLRAGIHSDSSSRPRAFILGQGLWNNLEVEPSIAWLHSVLGIIDGESKNRTPILLVTPNAAGKYKDDKWLVTQGNKALVRFEESLAAAAKMQGIEHLGTWNMSIQATLYDGVHLDLRGNLLKAMMVVNWLNLLDH